MLSVDDVVSSLHDLFNEFLIPLCLQHQLIYARGSNSKLLGHILLRLEAHDDVMDHLDLLGHGWYASLPPSLPLGWRRDLFELYAIYLTRHSSSCGPATSYLLNQLLDLFLAHTSTKTFIILSSYGSCHELSSLHGNPLTILLQRIIL